jgi:hypothetical protein
VIYLNQCALRHREEKKMNEGRTVLIPRPDDGGRVLVRMWMCVCACVGVFVLFSLVFNFPRRIPQFPSRSLCHEWELTMNGDMVEQGVDLC